MLACEIDIIVTFKTYQVSYLKNILYMFSGGLIVGRCTIFVAGFDNTLWFYNFNDVNYF